jgi:hypothetical protein
MVSEASFTMDPTLQLLMNQLNKMETKITARQDKMETRITASQDKMDSNICLNYWVFGLHPSSCILKNT